MSSRGYQHRRSASVRGTSGMSGRQSAGRRNSGRSSVIEYDQYEYLYGSAAPALEPEEERPRRRSAEQEEQRKAQRQYVRQVRRIQRANAAAIAMLVGIVAVMTVCLFAYIGLQSRGTNAVEEIADLESQLSDLKSDNEEALNSIESGINLDEIKYRAITELGMSYAQEDQIITYSNEESDYVRQVIQP